MDKTELIDAMSDMLNGWKYIRSFHGDLYGVGWDRAQDKIEKALASLSQSEGGEVRLRDAVRAHISDLEECIPTLRVHHLNKTADETEKAIAELRAALHSAPVATQEAVAWSLIFDDDPRLNLSTVFDTEDEAKNYAERCGVATPVPLFASPTQETVSERTAEPTDEQIKAAIIEYRLRKGSAMNTDDFVKAFRSALAAPAMEPTEEPELAMSMFASIADYHSAVHSRKLAASAKPARRPSWRALPPEEDGQTSYNAQGSAKPAGEPVALRPCGYVSVDGIARMCRKCGQVHADPIYATGAGQC